MAKKISLSEEEMNVLKSDYNSGKTLRQLEKEYPYTRRTISRLLRESGVLIRDNRVNSRLYSHNKNYFEKIDSQEKAYWLGFIYADGFIESRRGNASQKLGITISKRDENHLQKFKDSIEATNPIKTYKGSGFNAGGYYSKILITCQKLADDLRDKGVVENKTKVLTFPSDDIVPKHLKRHFIRGYFDGDGSLSYSRSKHGNKKRSYEIGMSGTEELLKGVLGFLKKELKVRPDRGTFQLKIGGNVQLERILDMLYRDSIVHLDRKHDVYLDFKKCIER